jgi:hypothetical protein
MYFKECVKPILDMFKLYFFRQYFPTPICRNFFSIYDPSIACLHFVVVFYVPLPLYSISLICLQHTHTWSHNTYYIMFSFLHIFFREKWKTPRSLVISFVLYLFSPFHKLLADYIEWRGFLSLFIPSSLWNNLFIHFWGFQSLSLYNTLLRSRIHEHL